MINKKFLRKLQKYSKRFKKQHILVKILVAVVIYLTLRYSLKHINWGYQKQLSVVEGFGQDKELRLYHWKNCGHCKKMMPEWKKFKSKYPQNSVDIEKDSGKMSPGDATKYNIQGYPTIVLVQKSSGNLIKPYNGARKASAFEKFLIKG